MTFNVSGQWRENLGREHSVGLVVPQRMLPNQTASHGTVALPFVPGTPNLLDLGASYRTNRKRNPGRSASVELRHQLLEGTLASCCCGG